MRSSYTIQKEVEVVEWHRKNGANVSKTARHFEVDRKRVREWNTSYQVLLQQCHGTNKLKRAIGRGRPVFSEEIDDALMDFLETERSAGRAVSNRLLQEHARKLAEQMGLGNFQASCQYIANWKKRFNVSMRVGTNESQKLPADYVEAITVFRKAVSTLRLEHNYSDYNIANMDQTMVRMDCPAARTNNAVGESSIHIASTGCARRGMTVALCATAAGIKLPALIVLKEPTGRIPPRVLFSLRIPGDCSYWTKHPYTRQEAAREALDAKDTDVVLIPGGCTSILQPADVSWMKPFKDALRGIWASFFRKGLVTPKGNLRKPLRQEVVDFVAQAWASVSEDTVRSLFKWCGISTRLDGSEDGELNDRLASVTNGPEDPESLIDEAI
ncbi:uncharacterized protein ISCGN_022642 [Ixodes scapularis]